MSRLRRWKKRKFSLLIPALTRWAKVCRASGAGRKANALFSSQRLRAGLKYAAPPALERGRAGTARRKGGGHVIPAAARNLRWRVPAKGGTREETRSRAKARPLQSPQGGACRRRDLSRREDGRRVRRAGGANLLRQAHFDEMAGLAAFEQAQSPQPIEPAHRLAHRSVG